MSGRFITKAIISSAMMAALLSPLPTLAQQDTNGVVLPSDQTGPNSGVVGGTAGVTNDSNQAGIIWLWFLPLLLIPLYFMMKDKDETREVYRGNSHAYRYVGQKGGEAGGKVNKSKSSEKRAKNN